VTDIQILGNLEKGQKFIDSIKKKKFLFSFVISHTEISEIPGVTVAGSNPDFVKFTPAADAEFLHYGSCKCIDSIPMTPDGKPTPALLTKVALEAASIPHVVINAGSKIRPDVPFFETGLESGKNISKEPAMDRFFVLRAVDYGRIIGRTLASLTDCLVIGESIPGGTTTALAVMKGFDIDAKVSSSIPKNPTELKNQIVQSALKRSKSNDPYDVVANLGDPMIPLVSGMISAASQITNVILAGGTQMAAVLAFGLTTGFNVNNIAIGTTTYIVNDKTANFLKVVKEICDIPILVIDPKLENSQITGLKSFSEGFVKEGAGAGGCMIAAILKTGITSEKLLYLTEKEYQRVLTLL
jgi:uncharacterized protein (TIGR00303 family)